MILLSRAYAGYLAGTIVQLPASEEAALIAQGLATTSAGPVTPGNVTTTKSMGRCGIAANQRTEAKNVHCTSLILVPDPL